MQRLLLRVWCLALAAAMCVSLPLGVEADPPRLPRLDSEPPLEGPIRVVKDVVYVAGSENPRQRLDLYLPPAGIVGFPVLVFVHGGAWKGGDRAVYARVGEGLAVLGLGVVLPSYRLTPEVRHPEHAADVARAVAWVGRHIAEHGGDPGRVVLGGHSAGAHLAALIALDAHYLRDATPQDEPVARLRAVIPIAGVYDLGRYLDQESWHRDVIREVFGATRDAVDPASPVRYARADAPPFLVIHGARDPVVNVLEADLLVGALEAKGARVASLIGPLQDHATALFDVFVEGKPARERVLEFIRAEVK